MGHDEALAGSTVITVDAIDSNIMCWDSIKFDGRQDGYGEPDTWVDTDINEVLMTNVEMRNVQSWGLDMSDALDPNYLHNCWFINGAGVNTVDCKDLIVSMCHFRGETLRARGVTYLYLSNNSKMVPDFENTKFELLEHSNDEVRYGRDIYRQAVPRLDATSADDTATTNLLEFKENPNGVTLHGGEVTIYGKDGGDRFIDKLLVSAADGGVTTVGSTDGALQVTDPIAWMVTLYNSTCRAGATM